MPPVSKSAKPVVETQPAAPLAELGTTKPPAKMEAPRMVSLEVPLLRMALPSGELPYARTRVDVDLISDPAAARALRDLADGLVAQGVIPEPSAPQAVRWLLRRLAEAKA